MNKEELFTLFGELDEELVAEAMGPAKTELHQMRGGHGKTLLLRRFVAAAAMIALMVCSGTVGALAFSRKVVVEVPVEQESITLGDLGLTLLLPDEWKDRYALCEASNGGWIVYSPSVRESFRKWAGPAGTENEEADGGVLFYIARYDEPLTEAQFLANGWDYTGYHYLLATSESTYILYYASDVQFDPGDAEQTAEYCALSEQIRDIRIIVDDAMGGK